MTTLERLFWERVFAAAIASGKSAGSADELANCAIRHSRTAAQRLTEE